MEIKLFPRAVYRNGEYAEAQDEAQLADLELQGFADWSIDSQRAVVETQQSVASAQQTERVKRQYNRKPKVQQ